MKPRIKYIFLIVIVFSCSSLQFALQGQSLSDSLRIQIDKCSVEQALEKVANSSRITFAYRNNLLNGLSVSGIRFNGTVEELLDQLLGSQRLCYTEQNSQVIVHTACRPKSYTITGYFINENTNEPIPYVSVATIDGENGVIADHEGYFELNVDYENPSDTLVISCMGYHRDTITVSPNESESILIMLKEKVYRFESVVVRPVKYMVKKLGNLKSNSSGSIYLDTHGQQTALFIKSDYTKKGTIESVEYFLSKQGNTDAPFRVRIYEVDTAGLPGRDLISDAIVVKPDFSHGWYRVDLRHEEIILPNEGVFIAIEGVFPDDYDYYYGSASFIDLKNQNKTQEAAKSLIYGQRLGYNRKHRRNTWHYSISKVWFQLDKQQFGVMIAANVKYEEDEKVKKRNKGKRKKKETKKEKADEI